MRRISSREDSAWLISSTRLIRIKLYSDFKFNFSFASPYHRLLRFHSPRLAQPTQLLYLVNLIRYIGIALESLPAIFFIAALNLPILCVCHNVCITVIVYINAERHITVVLY